MDAPHSHPASTLDRPPASAGIEGLKKMSTTAGLGSGNYAAINTLAVVSLVGSLFGLLALLDALLMVIPIAAAACAVIALRQISASNGTQEGRKAAWFAILLSVGLIGFVGVTRIYASIENKPDNERILALIADFDKRIAARDYAGAYQLSTPQFRARVDEQRFVKTMKQFEDNAATGGLGGIEWNRTPIDYQFDGQSKIKSAWVGTLFKYKSDLPPNRVPVHFLRENDQWGFNDIPALFKQ